LTVKAIFATGKVKEIARGEGNVFTCDCGKAFQHPRSVLRHAKHCSGTQLDTDDGIILAGGNISQMTNSMNKNGDIEEEDLGDCIGMYMSAERPLIVEDEDFKRIECMFNRSMNLVICRRCDLAIAAEYIGVHVREKHGIRCSEELVESIISKYRPLSLDGIIEFNNVTEVLNSPVEGIPVKRGYRCMVCGYCAQVWGSVTDHFRKKHKEEDVKEQTEENVAMQLLFGGRLRKWFSIKHPGAGPIDEGNDDVWIAVQGLLAKQKRRATKRIKEKEENVRLVRGFIVATGWNMLTEGEEPKKLVAMAAVAKKNDPLHGITELCQNYFEGIAEKLRGGNVLLRRKIASEGFHHDGMLLMSRKDLSNEPFKVGEQESTLAGNARMFGRMLCSVVRTIEQGHHWCEQYPFNDKQKRGVKNLRKALDLGKGDESDAQVILAIHKLSVALFCHESKDISKGDFASPVYRFLVIGSMREDGGFVSELRVTNLIAKLQWCCRAMIYEEMLRKMEKMTEAKAWKKLGKYVKEGRYTPFNSLREVMHLASGIAYNSPGLPQVEWLDEECDKASINGKAVTFEDIKGFVHERMNAAKKMLGRDILFGHEFKEFGYSCGKVVEVLRSPKVGYSFIDSLDNGFVKFKDKLMEILLKDRLVKSMFVKRTIGERIEWNKDGCKKWLKRTKAFLEIMSVLIHITYGQPARGEELSTTLIKNQILGLRSIYWSRERVMLAISYSKTRSTTGKEQPIARYLPEEVGDLLVKYLSLVRPMEAFIAEQIGCEKYENYGKVLFTDHERAWSGKKLGDIFKNQMNAWGPTALGFQEYRQLIKLFMRKHLKEVKWEGDDDILDLQMGHNSHTGGLRYGVGADDLAEVTSDQLLGFFHISQKWHRLLGFGKDEDRGRASRITTVRQVEAPMENSEPVQVVKRRRQRSRLRTIEPPLPLPELKAVSSLSVSASILEALRTFQKDPMATFKSVEQAMALQLILDGTRDVVAILPTGGGKSLLFFLPTMLEKEFTTVVIVPLIAVMQDLRSRCIECGISCANWDPDNRAMGPVNLLFVAVEHAIEPRFMNHLQVLYGAGRLRRIVMDEAHVTLTHRDFRPGMERLVSVMRTVPVQAVLLTATLPPSMEMDLRVALACQVWDLIRAQTVRKEIGYEVVEVSEEDDVDIEIGLRLRTELRGWSKGSTGELNGGERAIVYCLQQQWADKLCRFLNEELGDSICEVYHANLSAEVRLSRYNEWVAGRIRILVATSALGLGIDYPQVRLVVHQGQSKSMMDFSQESGRAGRDGKPAKSIVFTSEDIRAKCAWIEDKESQWTGHVTGGFKAMREWVANSNQCRQLGLAMYMDGKGTNCVSIKDCVWCDVCRREMSWGGHVRYSDDDMDQRRMLERALWSESEEDADVNMERAQQSTRALTATAQKIREMMDGLSERCVICWINKVSADHELAECELMHGKCIRCQDERHKLKQCQRVRYWGGRCCFSCGLPQRLGQVHIHGDASMGECESGYMDKMWPLCWQVYRRRGWRVELEAFFRQEWEEDGFRNWISQVEDGMANGVRVMLWAWDKLE